MLPWDGQIRSRNPDAGIWLEQNFLLASDKYWKEKHLQNNRTGCINYYAVVPRGNCSFSEKVSTMLLVSFCYVVFPYIFGSS